MFFLSFIHFFVILFIFSHAFLFLAYLFLLSSSPSFSLSFAFILFHTTPLFLYLLAIPSIFNCHCFFFLSFVLFNASLLFHSPFDSVFIISLIW